MGHDNWDKLDVAGEIVEDGGVIHYLSPLKSFRVPCVVTDVRSHLDRSARYKLHSHSTGNS
jgi:hypothetical protein